MLGLREKLSLAQFKPALAMNPDILARYAANRLRVVRQVRYSLHNENCIDLVLFLNGMPVATVELKTDFTQSVERRDRPVSLRPPSPAQGPSRRAAAVLPQRGAGAFRGEQPRSAHDDQAGRAGHRLPAVQPGRPRRARAIRVNPNGGHRTAYLWEQVWERESWLEILGRYLRRPEGREEADQDDHLPRFHQLDATRKLQAAVLDDGPGGKYLIQHSAGSGKTNSIAWSAHFLADLHDAQHKKLFDSVLVVSDRNVIDSQLQEAIFDFERTTGVVATIKGEGGSKSGELAEALSGDKKIVVCTIQTFPFALEAVRELAATKGKRFAVIADEAHSSQTGEAAAKLKAVLSAEELEELDDGGEVSTEDMLAAQMAARADDSGHHLRRVHRDAEDQDDGAVRHPARSDPTSRRTDNLPAPFHVYSMRQAIEENFILDVLQNYTTVQAGVQAGPRTARSTTRRRSNAARP